MLKSEFAVRICLLTDSNLSLIAELFCCSNVAKWPIFACHVTLFSVDSTSASELMLVQRTANKTNNYFQQVINFTHVNHQCN